MTADLTITHTTSTRGPDLIRLAIRVGNHATIVDVAPADFARALTGLARVPATIPGVVEDSTVAGSATPAPAAPVTEVRDPGSRRILRVGDRVEVKPSRPRKRDGWVGVIRGFVDVADPVNVSAEVSWPAGSARTVRLARIGARKASAS